MRPLQILDSWAGSGILKRLARSTAIHKIAHKCHPPNMDSHTYKTGPTHGACPQAYARKVSRRLKLASLAMVERTRGPCPIRSCFEAWSPSLSSKTSHSSSIKNQMACQRVPHATTLDCSGLAPASLKKIHIPVPPTRVSELWGDMGMGSLMPSKNPSRYHDLVLDLQYGPRSRRMYRWGVLKYCFPSDTSQRVEMYAQVRPLRRKSKSTAHFFVT